MKPLLCLILFTLLPTTANPQTKKPPLCAVTIDQIPLVRGLRLGQSYEQLSKVLPREVETNEEASEVGLRYVTLYDFVLKEPGKLSGVRSLTLVYFDDTLATIDITYTPEVKWQSNLHFAAAVIQQLGLPREGWLQRDPAYLVCRGFIVEVSNGRLTPRLRMWDFTLAERLAQRRAKLEEQKRARFRP